MRTSVDLHKVIGLSSFSDSRLSNQVFMQSKAQRLLFLSLHRVSRNSCNPSRLWGEGARDLQKISSRAGGMGELFT